MHVMSVRLGEARVQEEILRPMLFYSFFYLAVWLALSLVLAMVSVGDPRVDLQVVASGIASCMGGVGPGFGIITFDWSQMSNAGKMIGFFRHVHRPAGADAHIPIIYSRIMEEMICVS